MAKDVTEMDLISRRYTIHNIINEGLNELKHIEAAFRTLAGQHMRGNVTGEGETLFTLHGWMIGLCESYIGALHFSWGNEQNGFKDKQFIDGLQIEIGQAHDKWGSLFESAYKMRDNMAKLPGRNGDKAAAKK